MRKIERPNTGIYQRIHFVAENKEDEELMSSLSSQQSTDWRVRVSHAKKLVRLSLDHLAPGWKEVRSGYRFGVTCPAGIKAGKNDFETALHAEIVEDAATLWAVVFQFENSLAAGPIDLLLTAAMRIGELTHKIYSRAFEPHAKRAIDNETSANPDSRKSIASPRSVSLPSRLSN